MSQREAARVWGVPRITLQRAVSDGKISLTGDKKIDPAEMVRFFGPPRNGSGPAPENQMRTIEPPEVALENARLKAENEALRELVKRADAERDRAIEQIRMLTHEGAPRRRWWSFGR
ncbi:helix-turn-helix domain-containing protein [Xanthomonas euvesicatoria]|uniref:helix-turn-helix domain-containing protein n=1 Tax=Xanthomonas euvesicatoria TaxID=456327 RepID=UPI003A101FEA